MKGWIELNILCHTEESHQKEKFGIDVEEEDLQFKPHTVQISTIGTISNNHNIKGSFVMIGGHDLEAKETTEEIIKLIENDLNK